MGEGIGFNLPIYRYRGKTWPQVIGLVTGSSGFPVSRHVHLQLNGGIYWLSYAIKICLLLLYVFFQLYVEKGYLRFAHTQGITRMQLQHPVNDCNPLTDNSSGCETAFKDVEDLPYCTQAKNKDLDIHREKCEYFDEFDIKFDSGYQQKSLLIPTRRTIYSQNIGEDCKTGGSNKPCPRKDKFKKEETVFVADIEDFTLLIDHSMFNDELHLKEKAWNMIGFYNPCGRGKELEHPSFTRKVVEQTGAEKFFSHAEKKKLEEEQHEEEKCAFMPIHRPKGNDKEAQAKREKGFAMWKEDWRNTLLPFGPFGGNATEIAYEDKAPFFKIPNGDVIKLKDILKLLGPDAELDNKHKNNRHEGMVIVIDIQYSNWKEYTWPNKVENAYFYSFSIAPASEYKIMQDQSRQVTTDRDTNIRRLYDYHGVFILIQQHGDIGTLSWAKVFLLVLGALIIESLYRSIFTLCVLNVPALTVDPAHGVDMQMVDEEAERLDDLVSKEFRLGSSNAEDVKKKRMTGIDNDEDAAGEGASRRAYQRLEVGS